MRESRPAPLAAPLTAVLVLLLLGAIPTVAQEGQAPAAPPQPEMSETAGQVLDEAIAGTHAEDLELKVQPAFFPSLEGGTVSMMAFETSTDGLEFAAGEAGSEAEVDPQGEAGPEAGPAAATAELEVFAAVLQDGEEMGRFGGPFAVEEGTDTDGFCPTHSFGTMLDPGSYELVWGVRDVNSGVAGTRRDTVEVPNYGAGGLQITSVLVSTGVTQTQEPMVPGAVFPGVRVANLLVHDDIDRVFERNQQVELIYIVMGAQQDAVAGTHQIENNYRILDSEGNSLARFPPQELERITVGQPIPLGRIENLEPGGEYQFEIVVEDLVGGAEASTMVPFRLEGETPSE